MVEVERDVEVKIGSLGNVKFFKGIYAYVGSAQNNLEKRIERHLRKDKKKFWHIDYLLSNEFVKVVNVFYKDGKKEDECATARKLSKVGNQIPGFGSSDCNCKSHFFKIDGLKNVLTLLEECRVFH